MRLLHDRGELEASEREYRETIRRQPAHLKAYEHLAALLVEQQRLDEAILVLEDATSKMPGQTGMWYVLAKTYASANRKSDAVRAYRHLLTLDPEHVEARKGLDRL